jgi:Ca2+-transporting ATPase
LKTTSNIFNTPGLTDSEVDEARKKNGINQFDFKKRSRITELVIALAKEPMVILLLLAALIYFISGETADGIFLSAAILLVATISFYQDTRSRNALEKLKTFSQPNVHVIRNNKVTEIRSEELVVGDSLLVEEGNFITADGMIIRSNDFSVNESILTGESLSVFKDKSSRDNMIYSGTTVASGLAIVIVSHVGNETRLGKIGKSLEKIREEKTPLEIQIRNFVRVMILAGFIVFIIVWVINYFSSRSVLDSLLQALTLAMSILPEEIPVAFTTFMALGAWRLMKLGIAVKQMKTVETLGSATIICTDKTGTITENRMSLAKISSFPANRVTDAGEEPDHAGKELIRIAMWASEPIPFDPMEISLHQAYKKIATDDERPAYKLVHEYPLGGKPPMMTHVFEDNRGNRIIAAKGAPEAMMQVSGLSIEEKIQVASIVTTLAKNGYRVLGVGSAELTGNTFPPTQQEINFSFRGIVAFHDPPKQNINEVLRDFYNAGIGVKIITGDNAETTAAIAEQIGFRGFDKSISGDELMQLPEVELPDRVMRTNVFTRMFPEAKLKIINALKERNQVVAMTGDGVNDGPALKAAHIGIAMGRKGTEIAKQAASLILLEDDLSKMVDAVAMGRKIYANLKKAIQYVISIHIPIILTVFIPLVAGWIYPNIFSPVHIIFLELIMGPTCSIIYENEPMEKNAMRQPPKPYSRTFFNWQELSASILQGIAITCGTLAAYQYAVYNGYDEDLTRSMVFTTLIIANIFLTLVNRSFYYSIFTTLGYRNRLVPLIIFITMLIMAGMLFLPPVALFFEFEDISGQQFVFCSIIGAVSVLWYELVKLYNRKKSPLKTNSDDDQASS